MMIPKDSIVMDIGSDKGFLTIVLSKRGQKCYAVENKKGPYDGLVKQIEMNKSDVVPIFSDGLSIVPKDVNFLSLLGLGGRTIGRILIEGKDRIGNVEGILICPQGDADFAVKACLDIGFHEIDGCYIKDCHYYPMLLFSKGENSYPSKEEEIVFGRTPIIKRDPMFKEFLMRELQIINEMPMKGKDKNKDYLVMIERILAQWN